MAPLPHNCDFVSEALVLNKEYTLKNLNWAHHTTQHENSSPRPSIPTCHLGKRNAFKLLGEGALLSHGAEVRWVLGGQLAALHDCVMHLAPHASLCFMPNFGPATAAPAPTIQFCLHTLHLVPVLYGIVIPISLKFILLHYWQTHYNVCRPVQYFITSATALAPSSLMLLLLKL